MITNAQYPDWIPFVGGNRFEFFRPVFNLADSSITIGVLNIILFQRSFFNQKEEDTPIEETMDSNTESVGEETSSPLDQLDESEARE
ncbi:MAG: hypothetical protein AAFO82_08635 [Bacteroidota bacterium]